MNAVQICIHRQRGRGRGRYREENKICTRHEISTSKPSICLGLILVFCVLQGCSIFFVLTFAFYKQELKRQTENDKLLQHLQQQAQEERERRDAHEESVREQYLDVEKQRAAIEMEKLMHGVHVPSLRPSPCPPLACSNPRGLRYSWSCSDAVLKYLSSHLPRYSFLQCSSIRRLGLTRRR